MALTMAIHASDRFLSLRWLRGRWAHDASHASDGRRGAGAVEPSGFPVLRLVLRRRSMPGGVHARRSCSVRPCIESWECNQVSKKLPRRYARPRRARSRDGPRASTRETPGGRAASGAALAAPHRARIRRSSGEISLLSCDVEWTDHGVASARARLSAQYSQRAHRPSSEWACAPTFSVRAMRRHRQMQKREGDTRRPLTIGCAHM